MWSRGTRAVAQELLAELDQDRIPGRAPGSDGQGRSVKNATIVTDERPCTQGNLLESMVFILWSLHCFPVKIRYSNTYLYYLA